MKIVKKTLAELKEGDVLVGDGGYKKKIQDFGQDGLEYPVELNDDWPDLLTLIKHGYANTTFNVKAPEEKPEPHIVEIDGKQIRVSLVDGQPVAELVKPEHKSGDIVRLGDLPVGARIVATVDLHNEHDEMENVTKVSLGGYDLWIYSEYKVELA